MKTKILNFRISRMIHKKYDLILRALLLTIEIKGKLKASMEKEVISVEDGII